MIDVGGYRLCLRYLLGFQAFALQHVLEVHVAADIKLIRAVEHHAAILKSLARTRWVIVAPTWLLISSPMIGTPASANFWAHCGSEAMNTGSAFTNATPASMAHCA